MNVASRNSGVLGSKLPAGVAYKSFEAYMAAPSHVPGRFSRYVLRRKPEIKNMETFLQLIHNFYPSHFWYVNTIIWPEVSEFARQNKIPVLLHVHEREQMYVHLSDTQLRMMFDYPSLIIACSDTCAEGIYKTGRKKNIEVCHPAVDFKAISGNADDGAALRRKHNIDDDAFLWIMSGTMDVNKNPSVFVDIAMRLLQQNAKARFVWLSGGFENNGYALYCKSKADNAELAGRLFWISDPGSDYYNYFNAANGLVLTSTYESFSMIAAEALYLNKPVVSFNCGGVSEIISSKTGIVINDHDVAAITAAMLKVMNKKLNYDYGEARKSAARFEASGQSEAWVNIIHRYF